MSLRSLSGNAIHARAYNPRQLPLVPGTRLGVYEIGPLAGRGGMGEVYRARDTRLKRDVAIKILPSEFAENVDRIRRFEHEAESLAALNHPNIAAIHALEESSGIRFLVLEFVEGETLAERLRRGPLAPAEVVALGTEICSAVAAAHDRGIAHCDLKPANIKVASDGHVKLLDFGLARMFAPDGGEPDLSHSPTRTAVSVGHVVAGTAAYMAPEQARGQTVDKRADMWALGCVLFEMLTGRPVFRGETVTDILAAIVTQEISLDDLPAGTSPQLHWVIGRCLQKDPAARFRDAADAAAVLGDTVAPAIAPRPARRRWVPAATVGAIAVVIAAAIAVWSGRSPLPRLPLVRFEIPVAGAGPEMAVSPDGRRLVFVAADGPTRIALWLRSLDTLDVKMIDGTDTAITLMTPAWSPDSRSLAFVADGKLEKIDASGGRAETLATLDSQIGGISWSREGVILFASNDHGLRRVAATGGPPATVTERDASLDETYHDCPTFLPDGRHFIYLGYSEKKPENRAVYIGSLDARTRTRLMASDSCATYTAPGFVVFPRGQTLMARPFDAGRLTFTGDAAAIAQDVATTGEMGLFAVSDSGMLLYRPAAGNAAVPSRLVLVGRDGSSSLLAEIAAMSWFPRFSPDGTRVAYGVSGVSADPAVSASHDLWVVDVARGARTRVTFGGDNRYYPIWTRDGTRLTFADGIGPTNRLLWTLADGSGTPETLLEEGTRRYPSSWSPDGRALAMYVGGDGSGTPTGTRDLWMLHVEGDKREAKPFVETPFEERGAIFSPNGRWVAYVSNKSGQNDIYARPYPGPGSEVTVSVGGGQEPVWAPSGRELFYRHDGKLLAVRIEEHGASLTIGAPTRLFNDPYRPDTAGAQGGMANYDISPDGQRFVMVEDPNAPAGAQPVRLQVVLNWSEELKQRVPTR